MVYIYILLYKNKFAVLIRIRIEEDQRRVVVALRLWLMVGEGI